MKFSILAIVIVLFSACAKETPQPKPEGKKVSVQVEDDSTGVLLTDFCYTVTSFGLFGVNDETNATGTIPEGYKEFYVKTEDVRIYELNVFSNDGTFISADYRASEQITDENRNFVFKFDVD